jgi:uncharacterized protein (DUF58 family)
VRLDARWRATPAHVRATGVGFALLAVGVVLTRPDAVVLGTPLVLVAVWGLVRRPDQAPSVHAGVRHPVLREGQTTAFTTTVQPVTGVDCVGVALLPSPHTRYTPGGRAVAAVVPAEADPVRLDVRCQTLRWGHRSYGPATVALSSSFGAFAWQPEAFSSASVSTVPLPDVFAARTPVPHPDGLVGRSRSAHLGDGGELADIRPFRFGDRLRRVHWPVSIRTGTLHVTATHADQDSEILLLVDAMHDLGESSGIDGTASSLDRAVRAAGAVAEHYLRTGDRVGMLALGARDVPRVVAAAGGNHLRRLLDVLARVRVADSTVSDEKRLRTQLRHHVGAGTLVVVLTPAVSVDVLAHAVSLARRGVSVVAVDTLPAEFTGQDLTDDQLAQVAPVGDRPEAARLAWRIRLLERERELVRARESGVPIVPWAGPGTLDLVLRDLGRRSRAPRVVSR